MAFLGFGKKEEPKISKDVEDKKKKVAPEKEEKKILAPKKVTKKSAKKETKSVPEIHFSQSFNPGSIILGPRITEKSNILADDRNAYTFNVTARANKKEIKKAIQAIYKVTPIKINILQIPSKSVFRRGKKGVKSGGKKAVVYLREGDNIEFV